MQPAKLRRRACKHDVCSQLSSQSPALISPGLQHRRRSITRRSVMYLMMAIANDSKYSLYFLQSRSLSLSHSLLLSISILLSYSLSLSLSSLSRSLGSRPGGLSLHARSVLEGASRSSYLRCAFPSRSCRGGERLRWRFSPLGRAPHWRVLELGAPLAPVAARASLGAPPPPATGQSRLRCGPPHAKHPCAPPAPPGA